MIMLIVKGTEHDAAAACRDKQIPTYAIRPSLVYNGICIETTVEVPLNYHDQVITWFTGDLYTWNEHESQSCHQERQVGSLLYYTAITEEN